MPKLELKDNTDAIKRTTALIGCILRSIAELIEIKSNSLRLSRA